MFLLLPDVKRVITLEENSVLVAGFILIWLGFGDV